MFIAHSRLVDLPVSTARARLARLAGDGGVSRSAQAAYASGIERVIRVDPLGDVPGVAKLVRVRLLDPRHRDDGMTMAMRWEAMCPAGALFPVLDADLSLTSEGEQATRLAAVGSYRPPLAWLAGLDRALLHRVAMATIRALLRDVARALADPAAVAPPGTATGPQAQQPEPGGHDGSPGDPLT